ncbi:MAG: TolC family protein [Gemmatimonadota bacterium]|jgi:outer membrane protein|nr:TolC family protein [Gemmatimonadota bacterium]
MAYRLGAFALLALGATSASGQSPSPRALRLDEAQRLAERNAPAIVQAFGQVRSSAAQARSAMAAFLPTASITASNTEQSPASPRVNPATGELIAGRWAITQGYAVGLQLFNGFQRLNRLRSARAAADAADAGHTAQRFAVALQVTQQFFASLAARETEQVALAQEAQAAQQLALAVARVLAQTATRSDSLRARVQLGTARVALLQARNDRAVADAALQRLVGLEGPVTAIADGLPDAMAAVPDSATLARLEAEAPSVRSAMASVGLAHADQRAARGQYWPTLSVNWNRNRAGPANDFTLSPDRFAYAGSLRFGLTVPLFDQLQREQAQVQAAIGLDNAEAQLRDARLAARQTATQALAALGTARAQFALQGEAVTAAEEDLRVQQERYQLGVATMLDVLTSQSALAQARAALVQARFTARVARAQLEALAGRLL